MERREETLNELISDVNEDPLLKTKNLDFLPKREARNYGDIIAQAESVDYSDNEEFYHDTYTDIDLLDNGQDIDKDSAMPKNFGDIIKLSKENYTDASAAVNDVGKKASENNCPKLSDFKKSTFKENPQFIQSQSKDITKDCIFGDYDDDNSVLGFHDIVEVYEQKSGKKTKLKQTSENSLESNARTQALYKHEKKLAKKLGLRVWGNRIYIYHDIYWRPLKLVELMMMVRDQFPEDPVFSSNQYKEIEKLLLTDPKLQVSNKEIEYLHNYVNFRNCIYDINTGNTYEHTPDMFFHSYINSDYEQCRIGDGYFDLFVRNASNGDLNWKKRLLEILGCIIAGIQCKSFFVMFGEPNTGKTQIANFCKELIGDEFCTAIKGPNDFSGQFSQGALLGKKLCIAADVPKTLVNSDAVGAIKSLTGGDTIKGELKYQNPFTFVNEAILLFCTNHPINVAEGADEAFNDRMIVLPYENSVSREDRIPELSEKFMQESPYIVYEAMQALRRLMARNFRFTEVDYDYSRITGKTSGGDAHVERFFEEHCEAVENNLVSNKEVYAAYEGFCSENNFVPLPDSVFGKRFTAVITAENLGIEKYKTKLERGYKNLKVN